MAYYTDIIPKTDLNNQVGYSLVEDVEAVKNSIMNLFTIQKGAVPGKPWLGSPITPYLFDNIGYFEERTMETSFINTLRKYEPRVRIERLNVISSPEYNRITINLDFFVLINNTETFQNLRFSMAHNEMTSISTRQS